MCLDLKGKYSVLHNMNIKNEKGFVSSSEPPTCININDLLLFFFPFTVFIYSMPGYSCSIKERMLYSSCKSRLLDEVEKDYHLEVAKKVTDGWSYRTVTSCSFLGIWGFFFRSNPQLNTYMWLVFWRLIFYCFYFQCI